MWVSCDKDEQAGCVGQGGDSLGDTVLDVPTNLPRRQRGLASPPAEHIHPDSGHTSWEPARPAE